MQATLLERFDNIDINDICFDGNQFILAAAFPKGASTWNVTVKIPANDQLFAKLVYDYFSSVLAQSGQSLSELTELWFSRIADEISRRYDKACAGDLDVFAASKVGSGSYTMMVHKSRAPVGLSTSPYPLGSTVTTM
jgi:hypothetical protein